MPSDRLPRRQFLAAVSGAAGIAPFSALTRRAAGADQRRQGTRGDPARGVGYGPLQPVNDATTGLPLLHLPAGFRYLSFGWTGDPLADGLATPGAHDGMAAFAGASGRTRLVRNHERRSGAAFAEHPLYDTKGGGGTTTIEFDSEAGMVVDSWASLAGTAVNCAGGPTPWGSWLSCEETVLGPGRGNEYQEPHGYIFEVPADGVATAEPYRAMGRFVHEAVSIDPETGIVYETEDQRAAGFYRFLPAKTGKLWAGGRLEMLAVPDRPRADMRTGQGTGLWQRVEWIPIENADPAEIEADSVFAQGVSEGGATFARLEGTWYGAGRIYIVSTNGGDARAGQIWEYDPAGERLRLVFESPGSHLLDMPDNICVSPRGGLVLCEDGDNDNFVRGLTLDGAIFPFAKNSVVLSGEKNGLSGDFRDREFAGATYSPDGRWLFFNIQTPGITLAVTGPWDQGPL